jgi:hypothetical protein
MPMRHLYSVFIGSLFIVVKLWNQPKYPSTDIWERKYDVYTEYNE